MQKSFIYRKYALAFASVTAQFLLWAIAHNEQFQNALDLTRMQSDLVQSAFTLAIS